MRLVYGGGKRWIGTSGDAKPAPTETELIPPGSTFLESDTGVMWRYDGNSWQAAFDTTAALLEIQTEVLRELRRISMQLTLAHGVEVSDADLS